MSELEESEGAEVIPIGTRGRPGRGTGQRPSAAARGLAGKPAQRTPPRPKKDVEAQRAQPAEQPPEQPTVQAVPEPPVEPAAVTAPVATVHERATLAGIPVGDWQAAFVGAARELFGDDWEPQLARFLAFLRRRVTGDYVVDEYGFDAELTQRFLLASLRPIAEKWFRIEVRGIENIPARGGALVVSNHSGTVPVDGLMTMASIHDHTGRFLRPLGADLVFRLPFVSALAR